MLRSAVGEDPSGGLTTPADGLVFSRGMLGTGVVRLRLPSMRPLPFMAKRNRSQVCLALFVLVSGIRRCSLIRSMALFGAEQYGAHTCIGNGRTGSGYLPDVVAFRLK